MYRYYVFAVDNYYPVGGIADVIFQTNDKEEAIAHLHAYEGNYDTVYVYDWLKDWTIA